jgi:type II secretion system protein I
MKIKSPIANRRLPLKRRKTMGNWNSANGHATGFTLLEVMIAVVMFCTATFAILGLVSQSIDNARRLRRPMVDASLVAAQLSTTNKLVEGTYWGDLGDLLGDDYKDYEWTEDILEVRSNKLFNVDIKIQRNNSDAVVSEMNVLFYRPESPPGSLDGGPGIRGR